MVQFMCEKGKYLAKQTRMSHVARSMKDYFSLCRTGILLVISFSQFVLVLHTCYSSAINIVHTYEHNGKKCEI